MKTKQEQIEEMAKIVDEMYNVYTTTADDIAEGLYNVGYRKVPFDIRRCFNEIEMKMKFKTDFGTIDFTEEQILFIEQAICWEEEKIRKKTAKEIFQKVVNICRKEEDFQDGTVNTQLEPLYFGIMNGCAFIRGEVKELAEQYGVEVEE